jgi:hypothetical protein
MRLSPRQLRCPEDRGRTHPAVCVAVILWVATMPQVLANESPPLGPRSSLSLGGPWQFRLDPKGEGREARWFDPTVVYPDKIEVPGNWQAQGFGPPGGIARHNYQGKAWYRRTVAVPKEWKGGAVGAVRGGVQLRGSLAQRRPGGPDRDLPHPL